MKKLSLSLLPLLSTLMTVSGQSLPILYVTQVPPQGTVGTVTSIGGNHLPTVEAAPRGGDLMIRYLDGTVRNLTREALFGRADQDQLGGAIAVRDPHVHWSGQRAIFSMVINSANAAADRWQLFEVSGLTQWSPVSITRVPHQPAEFNNVQPCYTPDDRIIFVSDRTRDGSLATYPALDEKGQGRINTGLWSLQPQTGEVFQIEHSPSGSFDPLVDSFGRVLFTRWDHLQRDEKLAAGGVTGFDYSSEAADATYTAGRLTESFPEALSANGTELGLKFDLFMPWTVNPDGTDLVTLNHVGRHEISPGFTRSRPDANLVDLTPPVTGGFPTVPIRTGAMMQLTEHAMLKGRLFGVDAVTNGLSAGRIVSVVSAAPTVNPATMRVMLTFGQGLARDPAVLTNGMLIASVASTNAGLNLGNASYSSGGSLASVPPAVNPNLMLTPADPFRISISTLPATTIGRSLGFNSALVSQATTTVTNYTSTGQTQTFTGPLWQLQPVEVRATTRPPVLVSNMEAPEREMFIRAGVSPLALKSWLRSNDLAMMTVRNVTQRDSADRQQPTNLAVPGGVSSVKEDGGPTYSVKALQLLQGEYLRGYQLPGGTVEPGRRIKATTLRPRPGITETPAGLPEGSTTIAADGSVAALVPAQRATSWQLIEHSGTPVVRERYWLSFQAGEIRSCTSCHGVNRTDQLGGDVAANPPAALRSLLETVKQSTPAVSETSTFRIWAEAALGVPLTATGDDDADGTDNMIEWAMGSNPVVATSRPSTPLTVTLVPSPAGSVASISFSRATGESHARSILEASADLQNWRTVASLGVTATIDPAYTLTRLTNAANASETVTLLSSLPTAESDDRYYRLRVSAE